MNKQLKADLMLLIVTVFWGTSYLLTKMGLSDLQEFNLTALRFIIGFSLSAIVFYKNLIKSDLKTIKYAFILGIILLGVFTSMTFALRYTTTSNAGFLIGFTVVLVPIFSAMIFKERPENKAIVGVCFAIVGIALLTINENIKINYGDLLCILCAVLCALHIIVTEKFTKKVDSIALGILQLGFVGLFSIIISLLIENTKLPTTSESWIAVLGLSVFCTAAAYIVQTTAQKHTTPTHTALIFSLESVFAAIIAYIFIGEALTTRGYIGGAMLFIGILIVELDLKKIFKFRDIKNTKEGTI